MTRQRPVVVVGGGQAGLSASYHLTEAGIDHVVLERDRLGERWRSEKWDSFTLVTPNWMCQLPGFAYDGDDPDGFLTRQDVVDYLEAFAASFDPPVRCGVEATAVREDADGFTVETTAGDYAAANVVVATGTFQQPNIPAFSVDVPSIVGQLHSSRYRNPDALSDGSVLVVGSGQSGAQIAWELFEADRDVHLSVSGAPKAPRTYRGRDFTRWLVEAGIDETVDDLDSPADRFAPHPYVTGRDGGREIDLLGMADDGLSLYGRTTGIDDRIVRFADDLTENLRRSYGAYAEIMADIDRYIEAAGVDAPPPSVTPPDPASIDVEAPRSLDLEAAGVRTIVWATGYRYDFSWVEPARLDDWGYPVTRRGVTDVPGLYFLGLHWLHTQASGLLVGVGEDAEHVVDHLAERTAS